MNKKLVRELMVSISDYPHVADDASVKEAFAVLRKDFDKGKRYRSILVLNGTNRLVGLVVLRDLIRGLEPDFLKKDAPPYQGLSQEEPELASVWQNIFTEQCREEAGKNVKEVMSPIQTVVTEDDPIAKAAYLMIKNNVHVIPVVEGDTVVGVIRLADIFEEISSIILES